MNDTTFKKEIYEPYLETWKILKLIQYADQTSDYDAQWQRYRNEIDRLKETYPEDPFVENLISFLIDASFTIAKMNNKEGA